MKTKSDTIAEIMMLNPTVGSGFLAEFSNDDLLRYLERLRELSARPMTAGLRRSVEAGRSSPFAVAKAAV